MPMPSCPPSRGERPTMVVRSSARPRPRRRRNLTRGSPAASEIANANIPTTRARTISGRQFFDDRLQGQGAGGLDQQVVAAAEGLAQNGRRLLLGAQEAHICPARILGGLAD